jgi:voltage-gated potassium channel
VEEFQLSEEPHRLEALEGRTLAELQLGRRSGALVLAIRSPEPETGLSNLIANPGGDVRLAPGQLLVVMGSKEQLRHFGKLLGPSLADVGSMPA